MHVNVFYFLCMSTPLDLIIDQWSYMQSSVRLVLGGGIVQLHCSNKVDAAMEL